MPRITLLSEKILSISTRGPKSGGQQLFEGQLQSYPSLTPTTTYYWTCPSYVFRIALVCVGAGGGGGTGNFETLHSVSNLYGGGGGGLGWSSDVVVFPGRVYTIVVGNGGAGAEYNSQVNTSSSGGDSYMYDPIDDVIIAKGAGGLSATGGNDNNYGGTYIGQGGGNGGRGGRWYSTGGGGGGGAGGYTGNGGNAGPIDSIVTGAGGAGAGGTDLQSSAFSSSRSTGGGGVGVFGEGPSGQSPSAGGSSGTTGTVAESLTFGYTGGYYGGGGGTGAARENFWGGWGGLGAVRIIWGSGRYFPTTRTLDEIF